MRLARTSVLYFLSEVVTSVVGFVATLYFARTLGSAVLGKYFLIVALVAWCSVPTNGVGHALRKRLSEQTEQGAYLTAAFLTNSLLAALVAGGAILAGPWFNAYVGAEANVLFAVLFVGQVAFTFVMTGLAGQHMVARSGLLKTIDRILRVGLQFGFVVFGYGVLALVGGHALALLLSVGIGLLWFRAGFARPDPSNVRSLFSYARFAWLSNLKSRTFAWMDTIVLSLFVGPGLIGVYEVAWRLASILVLVSNAVQQTLFPEMSKIATEDDLDELRNLLDEGLFAAGLFVIPGLFGATLLGSRLLGIYGPEFTQGAIVLLVLIVARGIDAYARQFSNFINAFDRPDLTFRVNAAFVLTNLVLNLALVSLIGWTGAAIATALSSLVVLVASYYYVVRLLGRLQLPVAELGAQLLAAVGMAVAIWLLQRVSPWSNAFVTIGLTLTGAVLFFAFLTVLSSRFRAKALGIIRSGDRLPLSPE